MYYLNPHTDEDITMIKNDAQWLLSRIFKYIKYLNAF